MGDRPRDAAREQKSFVFIPRTSMSVVVSFSCRANHQIATWWYVTREVALSISRQLRVCPTGRKATRNKTNVGTSQSSGAPTHASSRHPFAPQSLAIIIAQCLPLHWEAMEQCVSWVCIGTTRYPLEQSMRHSRIGARYGTRRGHHL